MALTFWLNLDSAAFLVYSTKRLFFSFFLLCSKIYEKMLVRSCRSIYLISHALNVYAQMQRHNWRIQHLTALWTAGITLCKPRLPLRQRTPPKTCPLHLPPPFFLLPPQLLTPWTMRQNQPGLLAAHKALLEVWEFILFFCQIYIHTVQKSKIIQVKSTKYKTWLTDSKCVDVIFVLFD